MDRRQIHQLYDEGYAETYESKFLLSDIAVSDARFEVELIGRLLAPGKTWLDVACGTGFFLSHYPQYERAGLDLSPAMLRRARAANPGATFVEQSFCEPYPAWENRWDLVSCMWYAYGLVDSIKQVEVALANLAAWTSPTGTCFIPLADPALISTVAVPYHLVNTPWSGDVYITGILWTYTDDQGKKSHAHMIAPQVEWMREQMGQYFASLEQVEYPAAIPGWEGKRTALVCRGKRSAAAD